MYKKLYTCLLLCMLSAAPSLARLVESRIIQGEHTLQAQIDYENEYQFKDSIIVMLEDGTERKIFPAADTRVVVAPNGPVFEAIPTDVNSDELVFAKVLADGDAKLYKVQGYFDADYYYRSTPAATPQKLINPKVTNVKVVKENPGDTLYYKRKFFHMLRAYPEMTPLFIETDYREPELIRIVREYNKRNGSFTELTTTIPGALVTSVYVHGGVRYGIIEQKQYEFVDGGAEIEFINTANNKNVSYVLGVYGSSDFEQARQIGSIFFGLNFYLNEKMVQPFIPIEFAMAALNNFDIDQDALFNLSAGVGIKIVDRIKIKYQFDQQMPFYVPEKLKIPQHRFSVLVKVW